MLALYLSCLIVGGLFLALAVLGVGETDADVAPDVDVAADVEVDTDAGDVDAEAGGEGIVAAVRFLSVRNLVFFTAFFGLTGTLLTLVRLGLVPTLLTSLGAGTAAAAAVHRLMGYLRSSESGAPPGASAVAGAEAHVVVGLDRARPGKVEVAAGDRTERIVARLHERARVDHFVPGDRVVVVRLQDGVALVAEKSFLA
jgi:hypothetical protein